MCSKFLLIYAIALTLLSPLTLCLRHQEPPTKSFLSQVTTSTNSIDSKAIKDMSEISIEDDHSDEDSDQESYEPSVDVREEYERQYKAYAKNVTVKSEITNAYKTTTNPRRTFEASCSSSVCRARKDIEEASTQSIRKHILMKLGMEHEPNKTNYPKLTKEFRELLCKRININPENCFGTVLPNVEYQSDDPLESNDEYDSDRDYESDDEEVSFMSFENRIYAFPNSKWQSEYQAN